MSFLIRTILVVTSNADRRAYLTRLHAAETSYYIMIVNSGAAALNFVKHVKPHLFLLDYQLPDMNGVELYELFHEMQDLADVPAIVVGVPLPRQSLAAVTRQQLMLLSLNLDLQALLRDMSHVLV